MKRIALLTVLLIVVGLTAGFAIDVKPTIAVTGTASVTFGFDLDNSTTGFSNTSDASFTLSLLAADGTDTHAGTGAAYGSITISNIEFYWTDTTAPIAIPVGGGTDTNGPTAAGPADADIVAKIIVTPFEIGVFSAPGMSFENLDAIENADFDDTVVDIETDVTFGGSGFTKDQGTYISVAFAPLTLTAKVVSNGDWTANANNEYAFGVDAVVDLKPLTLTLGLSEDIVAPANMGFFAKVAVDAAPIVAWVGFEGASATALTYAAGGGLTFTLMADTTLAASFLYGDTYGGADVKVVFTEPGDAGLVPMLDDSLTVYVLDIANAAVPALAMEYEVINTLGYKVALNADQSVRPYATVTYGTNNATPTASIFTAEAGVEMKLFPLTTLTAKYVSGNLVADPMVLGSIQFVASVAY